MTIKLIDKLPPVHRRKRTARAAYSPCPHTETRDGHCTRCGRRI